MRVTGTLYVTDHRARIRVRKRNIVVEQPSGWLRVPIETVEGVVLAARAEITNAAIGELVRRGVRIAALSRSGRLRFSIGGPTSGNVHLRLAQYRLADDPRIAAEVARWLVAGKLQNCRHAMRRWSWDADADLRAVFDREIGMIEERIAALGSASSGDKIRGIEGDGTRRYFKCLTMHFGFGDELLRFPRRTRRPPRDPVNSLLSFTYGLVLAELVGALDGVGLDPQIGFLHRPRSGRPSLALDLLEELRPSVADRFVISVLKRRQIRAEHFETVGDAYYLNDEGRQAVLAAYEQFRSDVVEHRILQREVGRWALPSVQATLMARFIRGDLPLYPPFVGRP